MTIPEANLKKSFEQSNVWKHIRHKKLAKNKVCQQCGETNKLDVVNLGKKNNTDERYIFVVCPKCKKLITGSKL